MKNEACFVDRTAAGKQLAEAIKQTYGAKISQGIVVAMSRGGVVVASVVAQRMNLPMDMVVSGKISSPLDPEVTIGVVVQDGTAIWNETVLNALAVDRDYRVSALERQLKEVKRRFNEMKNGFPPIEVRGRDVILVDDGMMTGSTMKAVIAYLKGQQPLRIILAIPVAPYSVAESVKDIVDGFICLVAPKTLWSVGQFYRIFGPVTNDEVKSIMLETYKDNE